MTSDRRADFVSRWFKKALGDKDHFDRFFSLWIALTVAAKKWCDDTGAGSRRDRDGKRVERFLKGNQRGVLGIMDAHDKEMRALATRRGRRRGMPVLDIDPEHPRYEELMGKFERFSRHYGSRMRLPDPDKVDALVEILREVRNNTFHGVKVYDAREDVGLLRLVNPVLEDVIRCLAGVAE